MTLSLHMRRFFSGTLLSRVSGMVRDLTMAFAFGDHPSVAAFMVAFRLSNLFRRLLGEGPLQSAFIPYFEGLRIQNPEKAIIFFRQLVLLITLLLLGITCLGEVGLLAFSSSVSFDNQEVLFLTAWLLPGLLFICLYGLNISLLHCHDTFFIPSFAPFVCNLIWIGGAIFLRSQPPPFAMQALAAFVVAGFAGQWLLTLPATLKIASIDWKGIWRFRISSEVRALARLFAFGAVGVGAVQVNALIDSLFARHADLRGPIYLWYSIRLEQLALAIFGIACVSTIVPRLSRAIKEGDREKANSLFGLSYRRILAVMIPCALGIFFLGGSAINLLYGQGNFSDFAVSQTTLCLWSYTIGLIPSTMVILFSALFYARHDFRTPLKFSLYAIVVHMALNGLFVWVLQWGAVSTALATSFSAWINFWCLQRASSLEGWKPVFPFARIRGLLLAGVLAGMVVVAVEYLCLQPTVGPLLTAREAIFPRVLMERGLHFMVGSVVFVGGLLAYAVVFKNQELLEVYQEFRPAPNSVFLKPDK